MGLTLCVTDTLRHRIKHNDYVVLRVGDISWH